MIDEFSEFLLWEATTRDTIDFKTIYVDMTGDLIAGLHLSQIVYWHLPNSGGASKLRVYRDGHWWIAKSRAEWWDEIRLTPKQVRRSTRILKEKELVVTTVYKFNGAPTTHIRIHKENFLAVWKSVVAQRAKSICTKGPSSNGPKGKMQSAQRDKSLTETTTETTTENDGDGVASANQEALNALLSIKVSPDQAMRWAATCDPEQVIGWCEYTKVADDITNPPGLVVAMLRDGVPPPPRIEPVPEHEPVYDPLPPAEPPPPLIIPGTDLDARDVWSRVLEELRMQMTRATFDTWLGGSKVVGVDDGVITVQVRDEYAIDWLKARWIKPIQRTLSGIVGQDLQVEFVTGDEADEM